MDDFERIWRKIKALEGEKFFTKTGLPFTYEIDGIALYPDRTKYRISKKDFEKAYSMVPLDGPGEIIHIVRGPSYVWGILHDKRIY